MKIYHVCIVDDHISSQEILKEYISRIPTLKVKSIFSNAIEALNEIQTNPSDILFMDVEMPILSGLDFLNSIDKKLPVIITTAHSGYAKDSFDVGVIDFLHKPYSFERFLKAVNRVIETKQKVEIIEDDYPKFIFLKSGIQLVKVFFDEIIYIEAYGNYIKTYSKNGKVTMFTESLSTIEEKLPNNTFIRIHKSYIINKSFISAIKNKTITLENVELPIGDTFRNNLNF